MKVSITEQEWKKMVNAIRDDVTRDVMKKVWKLAYHQGQVDERNNALTQDRVMPPGNVVPMEMLEDLDGIIYTAQDRN